MSERRFTPPWDIEDNGTCFIVRDHSGQALSYVYYEQESGRRTAVGLLTRDEARRIAINIAKPPELLTRLQRAHRRREVAATSPGATLPGPHEQARIPKSAALHT
jgi:hypothetical protein